MHCGPVPTLDGRREIADLLGDPVEGEARHRVVAIGMHHDCIVTHFLRLRGPALPIHQVPRRASAEKVMPVKDNALADQRVVG